MVPTEVNYNQSESFWDSMAHGKHCLNAGNFSDIITAEFRHKCEIRRLMKLIDFKGKTMLDLGCGSARFGLSFSLYLKSYVGVDISQKQIDIAKEALKKFDNISLIKSNLKDFNTNNKFDIVYFSAVFQYMNDDDFRDIVNKIDSWLSPNGILITRDSIYRKKTKIKNKGNYQAIYRSRSEHLNYFKNYKKIAEIDSYFNPPNIVIKVLSKVTKGKIYNFFARCYLGLTYPLEPFFMKFFKFMFIRNLKHKFFIFERRNEE